MTNASALSENSIYVVKNCHNAETIERGKIFKGGNYSQRLAKDGFFSERADAFVISSNRQT